MAIYRGSGGAPSATDNITLNQLIGLEASASQSATNAAASETAAQAAQTAAELAETNAEAAQALAETAQTGAETAETNAELAQAAAEAAQLAAETVYDNFDDRYLGAKASEPALDNDGNALVTGALYFNTTNFIMYVYTGAAWQNMWDTQEAIDFSLAPTTSVQIGRLQWNATEQTLDLGITNDVTLQIGREMHVRVRNQSGALITNGTLVYVTGSTGNNLTVEVADNTSITTSTGVLAMVTEDIANNSEGKVTSFGVVRDVNTLAFSEGAKLYLGTSGAFTDVKPTYPNFAVPIGYVVRSSATVGSIFIRIESNISFNEINDLDISSPTKGDLVYYNGTKWTKQNKNVLGLGRKNFFVNSTAPFVNQEGDKTGITNGQYIADVIKWRQVGAGILDAAIATISGEEWIQFDVTTADASIAATDVYAVELNIEGYDASHLQLGTSDAKTVALQFKHNHTKTGTYCAALLNSAENRSYIFEYTQSVANTEETHTEIIVLDTAGTWLIDNSTGLRFVATLAAGSNFQGTADSWTATGDLCTSNQVNGVDSASNFCRFRDIQLEINDVPTDVEYLPYALKLLLVYRQYEESNGNSLRFSGDVTSASTYRAQIGFLATKRADPVVSGQNAADVAFPAAVGTITVGRNGILEERVADATAAGHFSTVWQADSRL